ncbi:hypothetical protein BZG02_20500 [Labilibaculum filiforme]|uniref:Secretion system C-terminal sorting domain-containing protein n=1 Tax=Labilibaculum filiforme TaxID=1940526 RepID=A0A2N3HQ43_9BACT|nr:T9SS type A sorting domain-containing protein [Labilibaculum filiforme]PKQ60168.1 hypothetical protein BZG02_20500 [Labilibaculum filiforme]
MIKNFTLLLFFFASITLNAQNINIPDVNFKKALVENTAINTDGDGEISESEAVAFTGSINIAELNISDLTGIEYFINITQVNCRSNKLTSLDLSKNTAITSLYCYYNDLTSLDLTNNTAITNLYCYYNDLPSLDLKNNTAITHLNCSDNQLISLDLANNTDITYLDCDGNNLTSLDLTNNTAITSLTCSDNQLIILDLTNNTAITYLNCENNKFPFSELQKIKTKYSEFSYISTKKLFSPIEKADAFDIDYSDEALIDGTATVFTWYAINDKIVDETVVSKTGNGIYKFLKQGIYYCKMTNETFPEAELTTESVTINNNNIIEIPDANFKKALVDNTSINTNEDTEISDFEALLTTSLELGSKNIADLTSIEYFTNLISLSVYNNHLKSLDLNKNTAITSLNCGYNQLISLDLTNITAITKLYCYYNDLTSLDLTNNTAIASLYCDGNNLTSLDLTNNTAITSLDCQNNQLTSLDLTNNTTITSLDCGSNQLTSLDLTNNTAITSLYCGSNQLTSLDLANNTAIASLNCNNNKFPFSELQKIKERYSELAYDSNKRLFSAINEIINYQIDYSSEVLIDGNETSFKWYRENSEVSAEDLQEDGNGMFTFLKDGAYYCEMTNASFPNLTLKTNTISIYNNDIVNIPDANFKKALVENTLLNLDGDNEISEYEAATYKEELNVSNKSISDLTGVAYFTSITKLTCNYNQISSMDLSENSQLKELDCSHNKLTDLNIYSNSSLNTLNCSYNELSDLSLSEYNNYRLIKLNIDQNHLPLSNLNKIKAINPKLIEVDKLSADYMSRQFDVFDEVNKEVDYELNYSEEALFNEKETTFRWTTDYGMTEVNDESTIQKVKTGVFKFLKSGTYHCEMTNEEFPDIVVATSAITINIATGINEVLKSSIQVYPNPVITDLNIKFEKNEDRMIYIYDVKGQIQVQQESFSSSEQLNISNLKNGMYILKIQSKSGVISYKILKQ